MAGPVIAGFSLIAGIIVGAAFSPFVGAPLAIFGIAVFAALQILQRRQQATDIHEFREQADAQKTDFTAEDRRTQTTDHV